MKRIVFVIMLALFLHGCSAENVQMDQAIQLRRTLSEKSCAFTVSVVANHESEIFSFSARCQSEINGDLSFTVLKPESIRDLSGCIQGGNGKLTFEDAVIAFPIMAEGRISPVTAPWILLKALRGGFLSACGADEEFTRISVDDSYEENALHLDVWVDKENIPVRADVFWNEVLILSMDVTEFSYL